jgi:hypothetical protein
MHLERQTVTLEVLSQLFGVSLHTLRKEAAQRKFPLLKKGRRIYVDPKEYREFLERGRVEPRRSR